MKPEICARMLEVQEELNTFQDPNWKELKWDFSLAITMEAAEGLESHGWKWWKNQPEDIGNCRMELVDIWHFMLSEVIRDYSQQVPIQLWVAGLLETNYIPNYNPIYCWKTLMQHQSYRAFNALRRYYGLGDTELARLYFAKAELNRLRSYNGYKEGTYIKIWTHNGGLVEDNVVASAFIAEYPMDTAESIIAFRTKLENYYQTQR
jgi:hypothetical protein